MAPSAHAEDEDTLSNRAASALAHANFEEAASAYEQAAKGTRDEARASFALSQAAQLRWLLGAHEEAAADEAALWALDREPIADARRRRHVLAIAARTTVWLAQHDQDMGDAGRVRVRLLRYLPRVDHMAAVDVRATAHGLMADVCEASSARSCAERERAKVLALAKRAERDASFTWNLDAQNTVSNVRLFYADQLKSKAERMAVFPLDRKLEAISDAERAYARVLGIEIHAPPPPPRDQHGGDPNTPVWSFDLPYALQYRSAQHSDRGALTASLRMGTLWTTVRDEIGSFRAPQGHEEGGPFTTAYMKARTWFEHCATISRATHVGDASACFAWLGKNLRGDYPALDELVPEPLARFAIAPAQPALPSRDVIRRSSSAH